MADVDCDDLDRIDKLWRIRKKDQHSWTIADAEFWVSTGRALPPTVRRNLSQLLKRLEYDREKNALYR